MQEKHTLVLWGHNVKVANKIVTEQLCVVKHKRAIICALLLYCKEHAYFLVL